MKTCSCFVFSKIDFKKHNEKVVSDQGSVCQATGMIALGIIMIARITE